MVQIRANTKKNYMVIHLDGYLNEDEVKDVVSRIIRAADSLSPGFSIINDISEFVPANRTVIKEIGKAQAFVHQKGVGKVIRIVGNVMSKNQLRKSQQEAGADYEVTEVETLEDALKLVR